ncbi:MAG: glycerol-3-phosphate 1-O-acyltransferase PlsY [Bacteroidales bacterium]|nr:glycerol-3-phosphate 1-O-acyltransferase PlsY [Bacteroidales bacterium]
MNIVLITSGIIFSYLVGSFSSAVWLGRWFRRIDVREFGSKNAGTTNTIRVLGLKIGLFVFLIDVFKGWFAVFIGLLFFLPSAFAEYSDYFAIILSTAVMLGHIFPLYTGFRGGKGVATALGATIAIFPITALLALSVWTVVFLCTRYVSLASISATICFPFFYVFCFNGGTSGFADGGGKSVVLLVFSILVAIFIPVMHHKNIKRLLNGTENRMSFKKKCPFQKPS